MHKQGRNDNDEKIMNFLLAEIQLLSHVRTEWQSLDVTASCIVLAVKKYSRFKANSSDGYQSCFGLIKSSRWLRTAFFKSVGILFLYINLRQMRAHKSIKLPYMN